MARPVHQVSAPSPSLLLSFSPSLFPASLSTHLGAVCSLRRREYKPQLATCVIVPFFQQLTGINAVMFYAPQLFASFGSGQGDALLSTLIIGAVNVGATLVAIFTGESPPHRPPRGSAPH